MISYSSTQKTFFPGKIQIIPKSELGSFGLSEGSLQESARSLIPEGFEPEDNIDILPVVFNLAVVNKFNKNGDGIGTETALDLVRNFANKPINIEHKKNQIVGHIIRASFTDKEPDFQDNDIESFINRTDPFFINAAGFIYSHVFPALAEELEDSANPDNIKKFKSISTSWEVGFSEYVIARGSERLDESEIVTDFSESSKLRKYLKSNEGEGIDEEGKAVNRLILGRTLSLGAALTTSPAADVRGIFPLTKDVSEKKLSKEGEAVTKYLNTFSPSSKLDVKNKKSPLVMDEKELQAFLDKIEKAVASANSPKEISEASRSITSAVKDALLEHGKTWQSSVEQEKEARAKTEKELGKVKEQLSVVQVELDKNKEALAKKEQEDLFDARMSFVEKTYALSENETKIVAGEVNSLGAEDKEFENYKNKLQVIFAHKDREVLKEEAKEDTKAPEAELETEEAKAKLPNNNGGSADDTKSLLEKFQGKFEVEVA